MKVRRVRMACIKPEEKILVWVEVDVTREDIASPGWQGAVADPFRFTQRWATWRDHENCPQFGLLNDKPNPDGSANVFTNVPWDQAPRVLRSLIYHRGNAVRVTYRAGAEAHEGPAKWTRFEDNSVLAMQRMFLVMSLWFARN